MRKPAPCSLAAFAVVLLLGGCTLKPDLKPGYAVPVSTYSGAPEGGSTTAAAGVDGGAQQITSTASTVPEWWHLYHCKALDQLVEQALAANPGVREAQARLVQAQADLDAVSGTALSPAVNAQLGLDRERVDPAAMGLRNIPQPPPFTLYNAAINASYSFDLWGGTRYAVAAQAGTHDIARWQLQAARLTLAGNVVTAAIREAATRARLQALDAQLVAQQKQLTIMQGRLAVGGVSAVDVDNQRQSVALTSAQLPPLRVLVAQLQHQLSIYMGRQPQDALDTGVQMQDVQLPMQLPLGLPSELAHHRPDIQAAEARLHVAAATVGVATANLYPQFTVSASLGSERLSSGQLLQTPNVWSLGAGLMQPLLRGGTLRAQRRSARAAYDAAADDYEQTVLMGLQQVADALRAVDEDAHTLEAQDQRLAALTHAATVQREQLRLGGVSEWTALQAEVQQHQAEDSQVQAMSNRLTDTAALLQAVGGPIP